MKSVAGLILLLLVFTICGPRATPTPSGNAIIINPNVSYQTMRGWEAVARMLQCNFPATYKRWQTAVINDAIDVGINRIRLESLPSSENPTDYYQQYLNGGLAKCGQALAHQYEWVNDNNNSNSINPGGFSWARLDADIDAVVIPLRNKLAAQGETLIVSNCFVDFSRTTHLLRDNPAEYGEFVLAVYQHMQSKYGFAPDSWEVILEPDGAASSWSPIQIADCVVAAQRRLLAAGFTPDFILPSTTNGPDARMFYMAIKAHNPAAVTYVSEVTYHRYVNIADSDLTRLRETAELDGKNPFMSELIGADYNVLFQDLSVGHNSSWSQFVLASAIANGDNGAHYFMIDPATYSVTYGSRTKFLRQFFKWVRRGAVMKKVTALNPNFSAVAFRNSGGNYTTVVRALTIGSFDIFGLPAGTYHLRYTTSADYDHALPDVTIGSGQSISASMPAAGVMTVYSDAPLRH